MTIDSPNTINTTILQTGQSPESISELKMQTVVNSLAGRFVAITKTTSYTVALVDAGTVIPMSATTGLSLTIPLNATVPFDVGTEFEILVLGTGAVTIVPVGGVTAISNSTLASNGIGSRMMCQKIATDTWSVTGGGGLVSNPTASPDGTVVTTAGPTITDNNANVWSLSTPAPNLLPNSTNIGTVIGTPGTPPTGWGFSTLVGLLRQITGFGTVTVGGVKLDYIEIRLFGNTTGTEVAIQLSPFASITGAAGLSYSMGVWLQGISGNYAAVTFADCSIDAWDSGASYLSSPVHAFPTLTSTMTQATGTGTTPVGTASLGVQLGLGVNTATSYDFTFRVAGVQPEQASISSTYTPTPGYAFLNGTRLSAIAPNAVELAWVSGVVWFENTSSQWYSFSVTGGVAAIASGPTTSPLPGGTGTSGSPFGVNPPAGAITIPFGSSIQTAINANPNNTAFILPAGTWNNQQFTPKPGNQFWGNSAGTTILDGTSTTPYIYSSGGNVPINGVLLKYLTIQHYNTVQPGAENQQAVLHGINGWTLDQCNISNNGGSGIVFCGWVEVYGGNYNHNGHSGMAGNDGFPAFSAPLLHCIVTGAEIATNNQAGDAANNDVSGVKICPSQVDATAVVQFTNNYIHDNVCTGLWADCAAQNWLIEGNTVIGNHNHGIQYETSNNAIIRYNVVNNNGTDAAMPEIGCAIFISSSSGNQVYNNNITVASSRGDGIVLQLDTRADSRGGINNVIHNNTITYVGANGLHGLRNYAAGSVSGTSSNSNHFFCSATALHWVFFSGSGSPTNYATYKTNSGFDAASTQQTGSATVAGVTHNNSGGSGWTSG